MRNRIVACILLLAASLLAGAQGARTDGEESRMILSLENAWSQAELTHEAAWQRRLYIYMATRPL